MKQRKLGNGGKPFSALGLGCMGMSDMYGATDRAESIATVHAALDAGVTLLDSGDFYGMGHNEMLLGEALANRRRDSFELSIKFGAQRAPDGAWLGYDARPNALKTALAYSLKRLRTDYIDIYRPSRLDPAVPIEDTVGAIGEMVRAGHVRQIGLSELGADTIRCAQATHAICDLQIEYSLLSRGIEEKILPACRELGIGVTAYGVLSRGLISGHWSQHRETSPRDFRAHSPRFQGDNLHHNLVLVDTLRGLAEARGCSVAQLAIAWVMARGDDIVPLIGARTRQRLGEALLAVDIELDDEMMTALEQAFPAGVAAGARYAAPGMASLDSER